MISLPGCGKKCKELSVFSFTTKNKNIIPYKGSELLIVAITQDINDSLKGSGRLDQFNNINASSSSITDNQNCEGDYYEIENIGILFKTISKSFATQLIVSLEFNNPFNSPVINKYLYISYGATYEPYGGFFTNRFLIDSDSIITNDSTVFFYKTLLIGSRHFDSVYELHGYHDVNNYIDNIYYTIKQGIVATQDYQGHIWYFTIFD